MSGHEYKPGQKVYHDSLGPVIIEKVLTHGALIRSENFEGPMPAPFSVLSPMPQESPEERRNKAQNDLADMVGSLAAIISEGRIEGMAVVLLRSDGVAASEAAGELGNGAALVGELEYLKFAIIKALRPDPPQRLSECQK